MRATTRRAARVAAYVATGALAISGTILAVAPAQAAPADPVGVDTGAQWIAGQPKNGILHNDQYDFDDIALSADVAYGLAAIGGHDTRVQQVVDAIEPRAHDEWYTSTFQNVTTTYAGSLAKLLVVVQKTGGTPTSFGGQNLVTLLNARVATASPSAGRLENLNDHFGDANTIGQAYAAHGLRTVNASKAAAVTSFLLEQQCSGGYFRLNFNPSKTASDQSCVDGASTSRPDTDATAIAILQLKSQSANGTVATAITNAKTWLAAQQKSDGSFGGGASTEASNANSTGLAAQALGGSADSVQAAQWLRAHQVTGYDVCNKLIRQRGAIAYDDAGLAAGRADGIVANTQDQWRRASAQALAGLVYLAPDSTPSTPDLSVPSGYLKGGSSQVLTTRGVRAGDKLCLSGPRTAVAGTAAGTTWRNTVKLPTSTGSARFAVRDTAGHADVASAKVLGKKTLTLRRSRYSVQRSHVVYITIAGLAPGEIGRIDYRGSIVRRGAASSKGELTAKFHVGTSLGRKTVTGYGQFTDIRKGTKVIKVVR